MGRLLPPVEDTDDRYREYEHEIDFEIIMNFSIIYIHDKSVAFAVANAQKRRR
jgi:hypothetical protein